MTYHKTALFDSDLQSISALAKVLSHPARLAILRHLAASSTCISGDISQEIPLSRTTVSQHLQELKRSGLIHGEIEGTKICYCICEKTLEQSIAMINHFFQELQNNNFNSCNK
jgi:ArsR family transcriptional regulator, arsenate/arsenite/antimonite-responsive transcriptional repressor